jgi:Protein of unknown function (DUF3667)
VAELKTCKNCGNTGTGIYCSQCGQKYDSQRITISHLAEEAFHFFTHFEKGFGYTVKQLAFSPGTVQRDYLAGKRTRIQKPFSMFFLCASAAALGLYWINNLIVKYEGATNVREVVFFQHYLVLMQVCLVPFYALISFFFFMRFEYNYAEWFIIDLYTISFFFLLILPINCLKFIWPHLNTKFIELPVLTIYNLLTFLNLFPNSSRLKIVLLSICSIIISYALAELVQQFLIDHFLSFTP